LLDSGGINLIKDLIGYILGFIIDFWPQWKEFWNPEAFLKSEEIKELI
jgi:hypothetical protein